MVVDMSKTNYAVIDLEPHYTDEDLKEAESFDYLYKEYTPRGGIHYLIKYSGDNFKFRITPNLEIIVDSMITFYGINYELGNLQAKETVLKDTYQEIGNKKSTVSYEDVDVSNIVDRLEAKNVDSIGKDIALHQYQIDDDLSHADFVAMLRLYTYDVRPYQDAIEKEVGYERVPNVLAAYAARILPYRLKHDRPGTPYLFTIASKIVRE